MAVVKGTFCNAFFTVAGDVQWVYIVSSWSLSITKSAVWE